MMKTTTIHTHPSLGSAMFAGIIFSAAVSLSLPASGAVIISEIFNGDGSDLNGKTATSFNAAITTAGGSSTWVADASFNRNGSIEQAANRSAYLNLGTYINDAKGTAAGVFTLTASMNQPSRAISGSSYWNGISFFNNPTTTSHFNTPNTPIAGTTTGRGTLLYRAASNGGQAANNGDIDAFYPTGTAAATTQTTFDGTSDNTGTQTLTIVLDLSDHDGITNFGTLSFYDGTALAGTQIGSTYSLLADFSFNAIGITQGESAGQINSFELSQIPEPGAALLGGIGTLLLLRRRRA